MKGPVVSEKVEQAHVLQAFGWVGGSAWVAGTRRRKGDYQGTMQTPGIPDVIGFVPDGAGRRLVFVEVKRKGGRVRPEQAAFREQCVRAGIDHVLGGLDAFLRYLMSRGLLKAENVPHYRLQAEAE